MKKPDFTSLRNEREHGGAEDLQEGKKKKQKPCAFKSKNQGFPGGSVVKNPPASVGDAGSISGLGRSLGEGNGTHSSILAWEIPWSEKPGGVHGVAKCSTAQLN